MYIVLSLSQRTLNVHCIDSMYIVLSQCTLCLTYIVLSGEVVPIDVLQSVELRPILLRTLCLFWDGGACQALYNSTPYSVTCKEC